MHETEKDTASLNTFPEQQWLEYYKSFWFK